MPGLVGSIRDSNPPSVVGGFNPKGLEVGGGGLLFDPPAEDGAG